MIRRTSGHFAPLLLALMAIIALVVGLPAAPNDTTADRELGQPDFVHNGFNLVDGRGLSGPASVAIDSSVNPARVYVADTGNNRVLGWSNSVNFLNGSSADLVIGQPDLFTSSTGCNPGGNANALCNPTSAAVDPAGNLYIADFGNNRVLEFNSPFTTDTTPDLVFGQGGSFASTACNGAGLNGQSQLCGPVAVAADASANVYIADQANNRVLEYDKPLINGTAATRVFGQSGAFNLTGCNTFGLSANSLCFPNSVAIDKTGNVYIADAKNNRVLEYNTPLTTDTTADLVFGTCGSFTGSSCSGTSADSLLSPAGIAVDGNANVYIVDAGNNRVLEFNKPLSTDTTADLVFGQRGSFSSTLCNNTGLDAGSLCLASSFTGATVDPSGNLYVPDAGNNRVLEYETPTVSGTNASGVAGQIAFVYGAANLTDAVGLGNPQAVAIDRSTTPNRLYVADPANNRVLGWSNAASFQNGDPADLVIGEPDFFSSGCSTVTPNGNDQQTMPRVSGSLLYAMPERAAKMLGSFCEPSAVARSKNASLRR